MATPTNYTGHTTVFGVTRETSNTTNQSESADKIYQLAINYQEELLGIYKWPFMLVVICTILGFFGNTVVLYIYTSKWPKTKTRIYFLMLAALDIINCAVNMPIEAYILWHPLNFDHHWLCKTSRGLTFLINNVCACVFVAIAIDRILLVYYPLKRRVLTVRYCKIACFIAFLVGAATSWPGYIFYGTATLPEKVDGIDVVGKTCYLADEFVADSRWPKLFTMVLFVLMVGIFLALILMYIIIGKKIYSVTRTDSFGKKRTPGTTTPVKSFVKSIKIDKFLSSVRLPSFKKKPESESDVENSKSLNSTSTSQTSPKRTKIPRLGRRVSGTNFHASKANTISLLLVTIAYIVSFLPYLVIVSMRYFDPGFYTNMDKVGRIAYHVFLRFYFLNSTVNPFIYSFSNRQFRQKVKLLFCSVFRCCRR